MNKQMIQWYPGHMAKAIKEVSEKAKIVDLVIVLLDARIPLASFNPLLKDTLQNKRMLYILTKKDKADDKETTKWLKYYQNMQIKALAIDARELKNTKLIIKTAEELLADKRQKDLAKGLKPRPIRTMIVGIPNVGKSTLINALVAKRVAPVGDKPGITKVQQMIKINQNLELLDTPGILWPKFANDEIGFHLAITGAINDDILPVASISKYLINFLQTYYPNHLSNRYQIKNDLKDEEILEAIAKQKNYYLNSKEPDLDRTSRLLLQEFRNGYLGKITLDRCETNE